jgi:FkbM family methyltransferase
VRMFAKLKKKVLRKYVRSVYGEKIVVKEYRNLLLLLRATNHLDRLFLSNMPFEAEQIEYLIEKIKEHNADIFVDVGANMGLYSLTLAKADTNLKRIIAIEAQKENYNHLCGNIFLNGVDDCIEARCIGASSTPGNVRFLKNKGNSTGTSRIQATAPASTKFHNFEEHTIEVETLDNLLGSMTGKTLFFKIDVEGHEYDVLRGMPQLMKNNRCFFQIEILDNTEKALSAILADFGLQKVHSIGRDVYFRSGF